MSKELKGGIHEIIEVPKSFKDGLSGSSLGDPAVVQRLIGQYLAAFEADYYKLVSGQMSKADFVKATDDRVRKHADIIAGKDPNYQTIIGYHERTLPAKLMADLGPVWIKNRAKWNDRSVCVFFEWLAVTLANALKRADGDEDVLSVLIGTNVQYAVKVILGIEERMK